MADLQVMRGPGRHDVHSAAPLDDAERFAHELEGEVVLPEDAARTLPALAAVLDEATGDRLRWLGAELMRAERILARTEARTLDTFEELVSGATGLAIHPQALRDAADAVRASRAAFQRATSDLDALEPEVEVDAATGAAGGDPPAAGGGIRVDVAHPPIVPERRERSRVVAASIVVGAVGAWLVLVGAGLPVWIGAPLVVAALVNLAFALRAAPEDDGDQQASAHLAFVGAMTDEIYSGRLPSSALAIQAAHERRRQLLELERDHALERLRVAERKWEELAGAGANPAEVDELLVRRDPQRHRAAPWVAEAASVRAAAAFHDTARTSWRDAWALVGRDAPPTADLERSIASLESDARVITATGRAVIAVVPPASMTDAVDFVAKHLPVVVILHDPDAAARVPSGDRARSSR